VNAMNQLVRDVDGLGNLIDSHLRPDVVRIDMQGFYPEAFLRRFGAAGGFALHADSPDKMPAAIEAMELDLVLYEALLTTSGPPTAAYSTAIAICPIGRSSWRTSSAVLKLRRPGWRVRRWIQAVLILPQLWSCVCKLPNWLCEPLNPLYCILAPEVSLAPAHLSGARVRRCSFPFLRRQSNICGRSWRPRKLRLPAQPGRVTGPVKRLQNTLFDRLSHRWRLELIESSIFPFIGHCENAP
jgi:hypothetical protein